MDSRNTFSYRKITLATALAAAALAAQPALADEYETIDAVSVTAEALKIDVSTQETPQTVNVVGRKELDEKNIRKLDDSLRYTPGFSNPYGADFDTDWIKMRGFDVTTLVNGQRQFKDGFFDSTVEPYGLESIEVLQGPASSLYGDSQPGGVVNLVSKKPTKTPQHSISLSGGSNKYVQAGLDFADNATEDGSKRYRIVAMVNREDSYLHDVDKSRAYFAPSFTIDVSDKTSLTFLASYLKESGTPNSGFYPMYGTLYPVNGKYVDPHTLYVLPEDDLDKDQFNIGWEFSHAFNDDLKYKQSANFSYTDLYLHISTAYGTPPAMLNRYITHNDGIEKGFTFDNNLTYTKTAGDFDNTLQVGFDYQWFENKWAENNALTALDQVDPFNPSINTEDNPAAMVLHNASRSKKQFGVYGQAQTIYKDTVLVKLGGRWDKVNVASTDPTKNVTTGSIDDTHFSWNAGVMLLNDWGVSPYVNYSEAFFANSSLTAVSTGYAVPDPTETKQIEYGIKYSPEWLDGFINVAYFELEQKNGWAQTSIGGVLQSSTLNKQNANGIEVQLRAAIQKYLTIDMSYSYVDKTDGDDETRSPLIPKHLASAWVGYDFTGVGVVGLTAGVGVRYIGSSIGTYPDATVPDVTLWDAAIGYRFDKHWNLQGTITNLTGKEYVAGANYNTAYLGEGRVARATLTYNW